jgi:subtilisin family serine protease
MKITLLLISLLAFQYLNAQDTLIVYFKDKGSSEFVQLSDRAIQRRKKNNVALDERDKQVNQTYIDFLKTEGAVMNVSRWLNGLTLITSTSELELKNTYEFIKDITVSKSITPLKGASKLGEIDEAKADYGPAQNQIEQIGLDCLHDMGYNGNGIFIAVIDAGFRGMDTIPYFDSTFIEGRVIDTYDILTGTSDVYQYSGHGTAVSSCIVAESDGTNPISATAVEVDIALYVSENVASETIIEEFDLVIALERADSVGADIATISLGYKDFDNPSDNHEYSELDGVTTIASIGVNAAVSKGILVLTSAGNGGPSTISTPCDADSCLCIGALDDQGWYADFSSVGPSADNQVKPDIMARGLNAALVAEWGDITFGSGTSFSCPIMAGAMACLMEANPQSTVLELMTAIRLSGNTYLVPNIYTGFGTPNMCLAHDSLNSTASLEEINADDFELYPNPTTGQVIITGIDFDPENMNLKIINMMGEITEIKTLKFEKNQLVADLSAFANGVYFIQIQIGNAVVLRKRVVKVNE